MRKSETSNIAEVLEELRAQVAALAQRLAQLEAAKPSAAPPPAQAAAQPAPAAKAEPVAPGISEEEILAVSAALAAFFGVRMRIRSIRLMGSPVWAQQGRVSIQASHRLHN